MAVVVVAVIVVALVLPSVQVCRDWAFIDRNTGSRKGYREWPLGWRTGSWYRESALEAFMRAKHPDELHQDWVSYAGTGRNIFGAATVFGHGRPGPIVLLSLDAIADYCRTTSDAEKRQLFEVFGSGNEAKIRELADRVIEARTPSDKTGADSPPSGSQAIPAGTNRTSKSAGVAR